MLGGCCLRRDFVCCSTDAKGGFKGQERLQFLEFNYFTISCFIRTEREDLLREKQQAGAEKRQAGVSGEERGGLTAQSYCHFLNPVVHFCLRQVPH